MKLRDIKEHFHVTEHDGFYLLFDKEINTSKYLNRKYYGKIKYDSKDITTILFMDNGGTLSFYKDTPIDMFVKNIINYADSLPYPSCFYNPQFRKNVFIELCVNDYLKKLGFISINGYSGSQTFVLRGYNPFKKDSDYITLTFKVNDDTTNGRVSMINNTFNWMEVPFTNLDEAIGAINSLIKPVLLSSVALSIDKLENISDNLSNLDSAEDNVIDAKSAKVYVSDAKEKVIKVLEDTLSKLKGA